jgi:hypothetical protein
MRTVLASFFLIGFAVAAHAQSFDGQWDGFYSCGAGGGTEAGKPAFMWKNIRFTVRGSEVSARYDFTGRSGYPVSAYFAGSLSGGGSASIRAWEVSAGPNNGWRSDFYGRLDPSGMIVLPKTFTNKWGVALRACQLTLRRAAPPPVYHEPPPQVVTDEPVPSRPLVAHRPTVAHAAPAPLPPIRQDPKPTVVKDERDLTMD